jgi:predicted transposase YdaD
LLPDKGGNSGPVLEREEGRREGREEGREEGRQKLRKCKCKI